MRSRWPYGDGVVTAYTWALARLTAQGYTRQQAERIVATIGAPLDASRARAVERLIRIHAPEYRRLLAQERGDRPRAEVDDDEFPLAGEEPPDPPDED
jgi:hypothetical protein